MLPTEHHFHGYLVCFFFSIVLITLVSRTVFIILTRFVVEAKSQRLQHLGVQVYKVVAVCIVVLGGKRLVNDDLLFDLNVIGVCLVIEFFENFATLVARLPTGLLSHRHRDHVQVQNFILWKDRQGELRERKSTYLGRVEEARH